MERRSGWGGVSRQGEVMSQADAYEEGWEAAQAGKMAADCPYSYDSPQGEQWMLGYQNGGGDE